MISTIQYLRSLIFTFKATGNKAYLKQAIKIKKEYTKQVLPSEKDLAYPKY